MEEVHALLTLLYVLETESKELWDWLLLPEVWCFQSFVMDFMIFRNSVQGFKSLDDDTTILEVNNKLSTVLVDLDKHCNYSVRVTAMTSIGTGPWSESVTCITAEDGKGLLKLHIPALQVTMPLVVLR